MSAAVLRDAELILAGVLGHEHVLGGPVAATGTRSSLGTVVELDPQRLAAALAAGAVDLLDEEMTPIATLTGLAEAARSKGSPTPTRTAEENVAGGGASPVELPVELPAAQPRVSSVRAEVRGVIGDSKAGRWADYIPLHPL